MAMEKLIDFGCRHSPVTRAPVDALIRSVTDLLPREPLDRPAVHQGGIAQVFTAPASR